MPFVLYPYLDGEQYNKGGGDISRRPELKRTVTEMAHVIVDTITLLTSQQNYTESYRLYNYLQLNQQSFYFIFYKTYSE